ncbi:hypothetical protein DNC80_07840 [Flavobacterium sp. SOK18b]|uniref:hypothetical protein n=1 Tax=Flavobacterium sp. SOK18b TaxID=797900 RepID=UPI0015FBCF36|nr:hypothetical protein [Flavobacterium sp. SOK18b]MBB1193578.1 hypothetical protein [Flavobacterium sp. SOK18b]
MNRELYINTIKKECAFLEQEGYIFNQIENNIYYTKDSEREGCRISFSWLEYGDKFDSYGISAEKRFNIIEQEIQKILGGSLLNYYTIHKSPLVDYIPNCLKFSGTENKNCFITNSVNDIELFAELIKEFYSKTAFDFFESYKNIDTVNRQLKELLEAKKIQALLTSSMGNTTILRFYVIAIVCMNNPIKDFFKETYFPYIESSLDNEINKIESDRFKLLQKNLLLI